MSLSAPPPHAFHDAIKALESYLGFWSEHDIEETYEIQPVNRTLNENKSGSASRGAPKKVAANVNNQVTQTSHNVNLNALVPENLRHYDPDIALNQARHLASTATSTDELYTHLEKFEALPLRYEGGKSLVKGRGNPNARLLIIGDTPDADEDDSGTAFSGKSGKMLDQMVSLAGLSDHFYALPAVFWRPAGNRPLTDSDAALMSPFLHGFISIMKPDVVWLMGPAAVKVVLDLNDGIQKLRGKDLSFTPLIGDHSPILRASFHPSLLLKQPMAKALVWRDLLELSQRLA
ncbi:uracil-DNA glycosylase [Asticcacaulis machinosus]|uniref:Uracil-DNA glycosylase n=1 Tax=Asticcacaulis machinosus TaxID=2984211 RepID=A0ABT5HFF8_9CAUL|nr:uracil-DNA glycosylase [Asticcacaulis machinosus]MDC7674984.1 uracil-DNA glycosylase [Asticcacaulis machinosus]